MKKLSIIGFLILYTSLTYAGIGKAKELYEVGSYDEAITEINKILSSEPSHTGALKLLMNIHKDNRKTKSYIQTAAKYYKSGGKMSYEQLWKLANTGYQIKDYNSVVFYSRICNFKNPNKHQINNLLGVGYFYLKNYKLSVVALKVAYYYAPREVIYSANLARSYEYLEKYKLAYKFYKKSLAVDPNFTRSAIALKRVQGLMNQN